MLRIAGAPHLMTASLIRSVQDYSHRFQNLVLGATKSSRIRTLPSVVCHYSPVQSPSCIMFDASPCDSHCHHHHHRHHQFDQHYHQMMVPFIITVVIIILATISIIADFPDHVATPVSFVAIGLERPPTVVCLWRAAEPPPGCPSAGSRPWGRSGRAMTPRDPGARTSKQDQSDQSYMVDIVSMVITGHRARIRKFMKIHRGGRLRNLGSPPGLNNRSELSTGR